MVSPSLTTPILVSISATEMEFQALADTSTKGLDFEPEVHHTAS
jgi:hypothetical protein